MSTFLRPLRTASRTCSLVNVRTGSVIADVVEPALDSKTRRKGLLGRDTLADSHALVLAPCGSVHTFGMRFPIDVIALDQQGVIIDRVVEMKPWRIRLPRRGTAGVLELRAGALDATGTQVGHRIELAQAQAGESLK